MSLADAYATFAEYKARTGLPVDTDQTTIESHLLTASRLVERFTGRIFNTSGAGVARYFDGNGEAEMYLDDFTAISAIELDTGEDGEYATALGATYHTRPYNAAEVGHPFTSVELLPRSAATATEFYAGPKTVKITGTWGWPAVPGAIRDATILIARQLRDLAESGLTLTVQASDEELRVMPGAFSLLTALHGEYSRRMPGTARV